MAQKPGAFTSFKKALRRRLFRLRRRRSTVGRIYNADGRAGRGRVSHMPHTGDESAMAFAESTKRLGKKGRARRRGYLILACAALGMAAMMMVIKMRRKEDAQTIAPGLLSQAAQDANLRLPSFLTDTFPFLASLPGFEDTSTPAPTPAPTEAAAPTPSPQPTPTPTPKPTAKPTPKPTPTPTPIDINKLVDYFMVEAPKYYGDYGYSANSYSYTAQELYMLAQVIHGEARGESLTGQIAVGNVVMNRVLLRGHFGNTISAVVTAKNQFTGYNESIKPGASSISAATSVLKREVWVVPQNVYYFNSSRAEGEDWGGHKFYKKIGAHCFYTHNYSGRKNNADVPAALFDRVYKWPQLGCKTGARVKRIQHMLISLGYKKVSEDGYFGQTTKDAIVAFQQSRKLKADGVAGPSTLRALIRAYGEKAYYSRYYK